MNSSPVAASFYVYIDFDPFFANNPTGIYRLTETPFYLDPDADVYGHSIVIVDYNDSDGDPDNHYWICKNSWGSNWADNGYFKVYMGQPGLKLETTDTYYASVNHSCKAKITPYFYSTLSTALGYTFFDGEYAYINTNHTITGNTSLPLGETLELYGDLIVSSGTFSLNTSATVKARTNKGITISGTGTVDTYSGSMITRAGSSNWNGIIINAGAHCRFQETLPFNMQ